MIHCSISFGGYNSIKLKLFTVMHLWAEKAFTEVQCESTFMRYQLESGGMSEISGMFNETRGMMEKSFKKGRKR